MKTKIKTAIFQNIRYLLLLAILLQGITVFSIAEKALSATEGVQVFKLVSEPNHENLMPHLSKSGRLVLGRNDYIALNLEEVKTNFNIIRVNPNQLVFMLNGIEFHEIKAFFMGADTSVVYFHFDVGKLTSANRIALYQLVGPKNEALFPGVKINEVFTYGFSQSVTFELSNIRDKNTWGWGLAIGVLVAFVLMIFLGDTLLRDSMNIEGIKTYYSFSKSQSAFWFLIVFSTFIYILLVTNSFDSINETALILLGISTATIATGSIINKSQTETAFEEETKERKSEIEAVNKRISTFSNARTKSGIESFSPKMKKLVLMRVNKGNTNFLEDIISDANGVAVHRLQSVLFNLVFGGIFIYEAITSYAMPNFTSTQFLLIGISNVTYVALKNAEVS